MHTFDTLAGANLEFPLTGHDLGVDTGNINAGIQASLVVSLDNVSAVDPACPDTTVIRTLRTGETALGPAVWPTIRTQKSVFLLETEPEMVFGVGVHQSLGLMTVIELVGASIRIPCLAKNEDVLAATERVWVFRDRSDVDVRVITWRLASRRTVKVPFA